MSISKDEKKVTREQLQAAYALNLCAVSVSQIIDYDDINILEQEYETILNNLNLEYMPKDEALLDILKHILETVTFFRIYEEDKKFIDKEYQQQMKNAIWSAVPNLGLLVAGGNPVTMAVSLASQIGIGYMNYRKNKAEYQLNREKNMWQLRRTAIEQFQALRQQLFETAWRLADKYDFPDDFRLTERQIKQYNAILMDENLIRKYERLDTIKEKFAAYPPFWYHFGNTANLISTSEHYGLDITSKKEFCELAKIYYRYFQEINRFDLLREDNIAAACNLEYIDLLEVNDDTKDEIESLLERTRRFAGNSLDVLQLCAMAYIKVGNLSKAADILRQLVNEEYNTIVNAQLLSTIYVDKYIHNSETDAWRKYATLQNRVGNEYLFPMTDAGKFVSRDQLQEQFIRKQKEILRTKYSLVFFEFVNKYERKINKIIPLPEFDQTRESDEIYASCSASNQERYDRIRLIMENKNKREEYKREVSCISYSYELLEILNQMFKSITLLECIQEEHKQLRLIDQIKNALNRERSNIEAIEKGLEDFELPIYEKIQKITLRSLAEGFFKQMIEEIKNSVNNKREMKDFAIAEMNLAKFCEHENISAPEILYEKKDDAENEMDSLTYFTPELLGATAIDQNKRINNNIKMINLIKGAVGNIAKNSAEIEFYTNEDPRIERYFYNKELRKYASIRRKTLAILDDRSKYDRDLIFTTEGIMPVIKGHVKQVAPYHKISWSYNSKKKELKMNICYENSGLDMDELYSLICKLREYESRIE